MNDLKSWNVQFAVNMQRLWNRKKAELARSHEQKIYRKLLVTLRMKSTYKLQVLIVHLKCLQQIFIFIKAVTQIVLGNRIELLHHLISQQEQHPTSKTKREIFKNYFFFFTKSKIDERIGFSLSDISDLINQDGDADLENNEIKGFIS